MNKNIKYTEVSSKENGVYKKAHQVKNLKVKDEVLIEGEKLLLEAIQHHYLLLDLFLDDLGWMEKNENLMHYLRTNNPNFKIYYLKPSLFKDLSYNTTPTGVMGWFKTPLKKPFNFGFKEGLVLVLENLQDPGNVGTIIRAAQGLGVQAIALYNSVSLNNPKLIKAGMGASFHSNVYQIKDYEAFLKHLQTNEVEIFASLLDEEAVFVNEVNFSLFKKMALIVGNEGHGVSEITKNYCDHHIKIPMKNHVESFNVAIATAILSYLMLNPKEN